MRTQSLKNRCQFIIKKRLTIAWKKRAIVLPNTKYEIIEQKRMQMFVLRRKLFFITDIDKHVRPKDKKE